MLMIRELVRAGLKVVVEVGTGSSSSSLADVVVETSVDVVVVDGVVVTIKMGGLTLLLGSFTPAGTKELDGSLM